MRRIYVDLDDVLAQTGRMFLRVLERDFGRVVAFDDLSSFHLGESMRLAPEQLDAFIRRVHQPDELRTIELMPGALEAVDAWVGRGYEIFVVTGRPPETLEASRDWLRAHSVPHTEFHFLDKYSKTYGADHHDPAGALTLDDLPAFDFCLAVEDFAGITDLLAGELGIPVALLDRPWNRSAPVVETSAPVVRCRDWSEVARRFPQP